MVGSTHRSAERGAGPSVSHDATGCSDGRQSSWWRVWAPLLARAGAIGLALLGLAGIGLAAARSESSPPLVSAPFTVGLAQLVGGGLEAPIGSPARARAQGALDAGAAPPSKPAASEGVLTPRAPLPCAPAPPPAVERAARGKRGQPAGWGAKPLATAALAHDGRVILNRAGLAELQRLPGIGAKRGAAILELRQRLGRFRRTSDLLRIKGIGPRLLERISPQLVLDE